MREIAAALLNFSVSFLPVTIILFPALLVAALITYYRFRVDENGLHRSIIRFAVMGLAVALIAGFVGMALGIAFFCSFTLGNLCGLGGVFLSGPLAFVAALVAYLIRWARQGAA